MLSLAAASSGNSGAANSVFLVVMLAAVGLLIIRANRRRAKAAAQISQTLAPGAEVITAGGQYGTVTEIEDGRIVHLEVAPGVVVRFVVGAIARVVTPVETLGHEEIAPEPPGTLES